MHAFIPKLLVDDAEQWSKEFGESIIPIQCYDYDGAFPQMKMLSLTSNKTAILDNQHYKISIKDEGNGQATIWLYQ